MNDGLRDGILAIAWTVAFGLIAAAIALLSSGCAINHPVLTETTTTYKTNGEAVVVERKLSMWTSAFWPATSDVDKQKAMIGKYLTVNSEWLDLQTGSTNIADILRAATGFVEAIGKLKP